MKRWYGNNRSRKRLKSNTRNSRHLPTNKSQAFKLLICLLGVGFVVSGNLSEIEAKISASVTPNSVSTVGLKLDAIAAEITVKVLDAEFLGSGIIIKHQERIYTVLTNQHVLRAGKKPYRIQAPDGKIYQAKIISPTTSQPYDLALLSFVTPDDRDYDTANIGSSANLQVGEPIFAAGFPVENVRDLEPRSSLLSGFTLNRGRIAIVLDKSLEEGYQIGYTNDVKKGMSGGPLLNIKGEVVGVNGKHAYPLWEAPDFYEDGSQPCPPLQELITRSSLAIPIEKGISLNPSLEFLQSDSDTTIDNDSLSLTSSDSAELVAKMQAEAEATKKCRSVRSINPK
jgi:serine protease Do